MLCARSIRQVTHDPEIIPHQETADGAVRMLFFTESVGVELRIQAWFEIFSGRVLCGVRRLLRHLWVCGSIDKVEGSEDVPWLRACSEG
jgi:hypothetical protein